jgi:hypothetical protein
MGPIRYAGPYADGEDRVEDLAQGVRIERQHVGAAVEVVEGVLDVAGRQRRPGTGPG